MSDIVTLHTPSNIIPMIRGVLAQTALEKQTPIMWIVGIDFLARFESEAITVASISVDDKSPTAEALRNQLRRPEPTIAGIPYFKSAYVQQNAAFLLDENCNVIKQITVEPIGAAA